VAYVIAEPCIGTKDNSCVEVCPVDATFNEADLPAEWEHFKERNSAYFASRA